MSVAGPSKSFTKKDRQDGVMSVRVVDLVKSYDDFSLVLLLVEIDHGEIVGFLGNNGSGKTTLLRLMLDLIRADRGHIYLHDTDVSLNDTWKLFTGSYLGSSFVIDFLYISEFLDFVADSLGIIMVQLCIWLYLRRKRKRLTLP